MKIDSDYTTFKIRRKFGSIKKAAEHFGTTPALIYMIAAGDRGQNSKNTLSRKIYDSFVNDGLVVFKQ